MKLVNPRGLTLQCSHYELKRKEVPKKSTNENSNKNSSEKSEEKEEKKKPVVVYCHGNSGSRLDAMEAVKVLLPLCSVFTFDFSGCGLSQGEYVSK